MNKWSKYRRVLVLLFAISLFVLIIAKIIIISNKSRYKKIQNIINSTDDDKIKTILLWNQFFEDSYWGMSQSTINKTFFEEINCPQTDCIFTSRRDFFESVSEYDAILFHVVDTIVDWPVERSSNQLYVYVCNESPANIQYNYDQTLNFYNWTVTYRLDSDVVSHYGHVKDVETKQMIAPDGNPSWRQFNGNFKIDAAVDKLIAGKTKMIAWFVSDCGAISERDRLASALQKYISVDIYGNCGPLECRHDAEKCAQMLTHEYKFYLSFENSLCTDYVTEKLFRPMNQTVVPIVYGGANYSKFAPPHSFINVEDFTSVGKLAEYLIYLDQNPDEYRKYFWWRSFYMIQPAKYVIPFCKLCVRLHETISSGPQFYQNIQEWIFNDQCRSEAKIEL